MSQFIQAINPFKAFSITSPKNATLKSHAGSRAQAKVVSRAWKAGGLLTLFVGAIAYQQFSKMRALGPSNLASPAAIQGYLWHRNMSLGFASLTLITTGYTALFLAAARRCPDVDSLAHHQRVMVNELAALFKKETGTVDSKDVINVINALNNQLLPTGAEAKNNPYVEYLSNVTTTICGKRTTANKCVAFHKRAGITNKHMGVTNLSDLAGIKGYRVLSNCKSN